MSSCYVSILFTCFMCIVKENMMLLVLPKFRIFYSISYVTTYETTLCIHFNVLHVLVSFVILKHLLND